MRYGSMIGPVSRKAGGLKFHSRSAPVHH